MSSWTLSILVIGLFYHQEAFSAPQQPHDPNSYHPHPFLPTLPPHPTPQQLSLVGIRTHGHRTVAPGPLPSPSTYPSSSKSPSSPSKFSKSKVDLTHPTNPVDPTQAKILKQINRLNDDGSYTFGYEADDGSFKVETRSKEGVVKGKYGFVGPDGNLETIEYTAGEKSPTDEAEEEDSNDPRASGPRSRNKAQGRPRDLSVASSSDNKPIKSSSSSSGASSGREDNSGSSEGGGGGGNYSGGSSSEEKLNGGSSGALQSSREGNEGQGSLAGRGDDSSSDERSNELESFGGPSSRHPTKPSQLVSRQVIPRQGGSIGSGGQYYPQDSPRYVPTTHLTGGQFSDPQIGGQGQRFSTSPNGRPILTHASQPQYPTSAGPGPEYYESPYNGRGQQEGLYEQPGQFQYPTRGQQQFSSGPIQQFIPGGGVAGGPGGSRPSPQYFGGPEALEYEEGGRIPGGIGGRGSPSGPGFGRGGGGGRQLLGLSRLSPFQQQLEFQQQQQGFGSGGPISGGIVGPTRFPPSANFGEGPGPGLARGQSQFGRQEIDPNSGQEYYPSLELEGYSEDVDQDGFVDHYPGSGRGGPRPSPSPSSTGSRDGKAAQAAEKNPAIKTPDGEKINPEGPGGLGGGQYAPTHPGFSPYAQSPSPYLLQQHQQQQLLLQQQGQGGPRRPGLIGGGSLQPEPYPQLSPYDPQTLELYPSSQGPQQFGGGLGLGRPGPQYINSGGGRFSGLNSGGPQPQLLSYDPRFQQQQQYSPQLLQQLQYQQQGLGSGGARQPGRASSLQYLDPEDLNQYPLQRFPQGQGRYLTRTQGQQQPLYSQLQPQLDFVPSPYLGGGPEASLDRFHPLAYNGVAGGGGAVDGTQSGSQRYPQSRSGQTPGQVAQLTSTHRGVQSSVSESKKGQ